MWLPSTNAFCYLLCVWERKAERERWQSMKCHGIKEVLNSDFSQQLADIFNNISWVTIFLPLIRHPAFKNRSDKIQSPISIQGESRMLIFWAPLLSSDTLTFRHCCMALMCYESVLKSSWVSVLNLETCGIVLALASDSEHLTFRQRMCKYWVFTSTISDLHLSMRNATGDKHCGLDKPGKGLRSLKVNWA